MKLFLKNVRPTKKNKSQFQPKMIPKGTYLKAVLNSMRILIVYRIITKALGIEKHKTETLS